MCQSCGTALVQPERQYCAACYPERREEQVEAWVTNKLEALARLREEGRDPAHSEEADRKRAERMMVQWNAARAWEAAASGDEEAMDFVRDVLPRLRGVPLGRMAEATGLSPGYCSFVRRGLKVPHRRHWPTLAHLATVGTTSNELKAYHGRPPRREATE
jgi:hypothetical protein